VEDDALSFRAYVQAAPHWGPLTHEFNVARVGEGYYDILDPLVFRRVPNGSAFEPIRFEGSTEFLQAIVNACWDAGIRPQRDTAGENVVLKGWLEDMRKLAGVK
jgi:hypothetical protein